MRNKSILSVFTESELRSKLFNMTLNISPSLSGIVQNQSNDGLADQVSKLKVACEKMRDELVEVNNLCREIELMGGDIKRSDLSLVSEDN